MPGASVYMRIFTGSNQNPPAPHSKRCGGESQEEGSGTVKRSYHPFGKTRAAEIGEMGTGTGDIIPSLHVKQAVFVLETGARGPGLSREGWRTFSLAASSSASCFADMDLRRRSKMHATACPVVCVMVKRANKPRKPASQLKTKSGSDGCTIAGEGVAQVFEGWNGGHVSWVPRKDEYASSDVNIRMDEWRQTVETRWIVELIAIGFSC